MNHFEIIMSILLGGFTAFILFLLGYAGYSIVKYNKRKQLKQQKKQEMAEKIRMEQYLNNMDADLKREIDSAVREHNRKAGMEFADSNNYDNNFSNDLAGKINNIIKKFLFAIMDKGEEKYRYLNEKYKFDKDNETLNNLKDVLHQGIDKVADNIGKWDNLKHKG